MSGVRWIALGALSMGIAVALGAFGAHALKERLIEAGQLENWHTAVRYQAWHALALLALGLVPRGLAPRACGWLFLVGSVLFSGSIYGLALEGPGKILGPITPMGGSLLIVAWGMLAVAAVARLLWRIEVGEEFEPALQAAAGLTVADLDQGAGERARESQGVDAR